MLIRPNESETAVHATGRVIWCHACARYCQPGLPCLNFMPLFSKVMCQITESGTAGEVKSHFHIRFPLVDK